MTEISIRRRYISTKKRREARCVTTLGGGNHFSVHFEEGRESIPLRERVGGYVPTPTMKKGKKTLKTEKKKNFSSEKKRRKTPT